MCFVQPQPSPKLAPKEVAKESMGCAAISERIEHMLEGTKCHDTSERTEHGATLEETEFCDTAKGTEHNDMWVGIKYTDMSEIPFWREIANA